MKKMENKQLTDTWQQFKLWMDEIESCNYECQAGYLINHIAWIEMKEEVKTIAETPIILPRPESHSDQMIDIMNNE